ncbi:MAG: ComEA family DNA-binding protein [Phycisphaerae bacterium]
MAVPAKVKVDITWRRGNLLALIVLCAASAGGLAWAGLSGRTALPENVPVNRANVAAARERIDPNTAATASLRRLHGIGPSHAQAIIDYRTSFTAAHSRPAFLRPEDLDNVRGLGPATIQRFQEQLTFSATTP